MEHRTMLNVEQNQCRLALSVWTSPISMVWERTRQCKNTVTSTQLKCIDVMTSSFDLLNRLKETIFRLVEQIIFLLLQITSLFFVFNRSNLKQHAFHIGSPTILCTSEKHFTSVASIHIALGLCFRISQTLLLPVMKRDFQLYQHSDIWKLLIQPYVCFSLYE